MTNTGEGALQEVHSMLQRMKTLAVQAANGTYDSVARANIDMERQELLGEIDRISQTTDFAGIPLFGTAETIPPGFTSVIHRKRPWMWDGIIWEAENCFWTRSALAAERLPMRQWERLTRQLKRWLT